MSKYVQNTGKRQDGPGHYSVTMLNEENGCSAGLQMGYMIYESAEYLSFAVHDDQEGFFVLEGAGFASIDGEETPIAPGDAIIVPVGKSHSFRKSADVPVLKMFSFHAKA